MSHSFSEALARFADVLNIDESFLDLIKVPDRLKTNLVGLDQLGEEDLGSLEAEMGIADAEDEAWDDVDDEPAPPTKQPRGRKTKQ